MRQWRYLTHPRSRLLHLADADPLIPKTSARTFCGLRITSAWRQGQVTADAVAAGCGRCRENSLTRAPRF